jgi:flavin reductase (DIM6/NTAB) family NADH-FMN oxidoreductase RutF
VVTDMAPRVPGLSAHDSAHDSANDSASAHNHAALRAALGHYATGVAVVTATGPDGRPAGMTINSFGSLSLDPPLILWCLRRRSTSLATFVSADHFAVNVLAADQEQVARRFAARTQAEVQDRFRGPGWHRGPKGLPVLDDGLGVFICRRLRHIHGGDHVIVIGHLDEYQVTPGKSPLVFYAGRYLNVPAATAASTMP